MNEILRCFWEGLKFVLVAIFLVFLTVFTLLTLEKNFPGIAITIIVVAGFVGLCYFIGFTKRNL